MEMPPKSLATSTNKPCCHFDCRVTEGHGNNDQITIHRMTFRWFNNYGKFTAIPLHAKFVKAVIHQLYLAGIKASPTSHKFSVPNFNGDTSNGTRGVWLLNQRSRKT